MTSVRLRWAGALTVIAVLAAAFNLRPAVVSIGPLLDDIRATTGLSGLGAGVLTGLSVACFGIFAPLAGRLSRRFGIERVLLGAVALLVPMLALRLIGTIPVLFVSVLVCGAAIAVANVLVPSVMRRASAQRVGLLMGFYLVVLNGAAALSAAIAVPMRDAFDDRWAASLAFWAIPAAIATAIGAFAWWGRSTAPPPASGGSHRLERSSVTWALPLFMSLQVAQFYGSSAWLPTIFHEAGATEAHAGTLLATMQLVGVVTGLGVPILAARARQQSWFPLAAVLLWSVGWLGIIVSPMGAPLVWMIVMGLGQGAGISIALTLIVLRAADADASTALSVRTHRDGYVLGALGPLVIGALHAATGEWRVPLLVMLASMVPMAISGWLAGRPLTVRTVPE